MSLQRSSTSSRPTREPDQTVRDAEAGRGVASGIEACVMVAGCSASDSTPPRLSASVKSLSELRKFRAAAMPPVELEADHAAAARHLASGRARARGGSAARGSGRRALQAPARAAARASSAVSAWRRMRSGSVLSPRSTR